MTEELRPWLCWVKVQGAGSKLNFPRVRVISKHCTDQVNKTSRGIETELVLVYVHRVLGRRGSAATCKKRNRSFIVGLCFPQRGVCGSYSEPVQTWEKAEIMWNDRQGESVRGRIVQLLFFVRHGDKMLWFEAEVMCVLKIQQILSSYFGVVTVTVRIPFNGLIPYTLYF